jgi:MATE family multidrug resistance protein
MAHDRQSHEDASVALEECKEEQGASDSTAAVAGEGCQTDLRSRLNIEIGSIFELSLPIVLSSVLNNMASIVDLAMVGHLGKEELAVASLGLAFYNTVFFPMSGVAMALDTLFSQAHGARNYALYATWLLAGSACLLMLSIIVSVILLSAEPILLAMKMETQLSVDAATYVSYLLPGMFANVAFLVLQKYLQSQEIVAPCVYIAAVSVVDSVGVGAELLGLLQNYLPDLVP